MIIAVNFQFKQLEYMNHFKYITSFWCIAGSKIKSGSVVFFKKMLVLCISLFLSSCIAVESFCWTYNIYDTSRIYSIFHPKFFQITLAQTSMVFPRIISFLKLSETKLLFIDTDKNWNYSKRHITSRKEGHGLTHA